MGTDVAVREPSTQVTVRLSADQLQYIANTDFVPKSMRGRMPAILACVAMGRELGLGDMVALNTIHVIDGRTSLSAEAMVGLVRKRGHSIQGNFSGDSCTVTGKRADNGDEMTVTWSREMAEAAGLLGKDNWRKYAPAMLWARAVSQLCRMLFTDCFAGATYTPDEVADGDFAEIEDSVGEPQAEETSAALTPPAVSTVSDAPAQPGEQPSPADTPSEPMLKKLNVLVGTLREQGHITTKDVYTAVGRIAYERDGHPHVIEAISDDGELHWSPLRDTLTRQEASDLIELLSKVEADVNGLSAAAFRANVKDHGISAEAGAAAMHRLFPGVEKSSDLSDVQRAQVWKELRA